MASSKPKKSSEAELRVLCNLVAAGRPVDFHCRTRSDHGGLNGALASLHRYSWLAIGEFTDAGWVSASFSNQALA